MRFFKKQYLIQFGGTMIKFIFSCVCSIVIASAGLYGQAPKATDPGCDPIAANDPIAAMLDSLVNINHVIRFSYLNDGQQALENNGVFNVPRFNDEEYKRRMSKIVTPIPLSFNPQVKNYIDLYAVRKRELTARVMGLANLYFPMFEEVLDREGLPLEFKYLSVVESALNPLAVSPMGATGIWQFMFNTGKLYDLKVTSYTDERKDPYKSTVAACKYFKDMYAIYGDWLLVIASYNCGPGNVNRAINRSGGKTNFWEICRYLPAETRGYVPAFIAVCYLMNYSREHNLFPVSPEFSYYDVDTVTVHSAASFATISKAIDLPEDVLAYLNPMIKRRFIPDTDEPYNLRLPVNKVYTFVSQEKNIFSTDAVAPLPAVAYGTNSKTKAPVDASLAPGEMVFKQVKKTHLVQRGETINEIADRYNCSIGEIKKMNNLKSSKIHSGQKLRVYAMVKVKEGPKETILPEAEIAENNTTSGNADTSVSGSDVKTADATDTAALKKAKTPPLMKYIYHLVQKGDTLATIAKRYDGVTIQQLKDFNKIKSSNQLKPGTKIKVMLAS